MNNVDKTSEEVFVYKLKESPKQEPLLLGTYINRDAVVGKVSINPDKFSKLDSDRIVVLKDADTSWFPLIKQAKGMIYEEGTKADHFVQMAREMNIPALIGAKNASNTLKNEQKITMYPLSNAKIETETDNGAVVNGYFELTHEKLTLSDVPRTKTKIFAVCSYEGRLKQLKHLPLAGVSPIRFEFLNSFTLQIHPRALVDYAKGKLEDKKAKKTIDDLFENMFGTTDNPLNYYINQIVEEIYQIAEHIKGKRIDYRFCDLRTDDAIKLIGGEAYEPQELNPMMGWRGTTKLIDDSYRDAFYLELEIIKRLKKKLINCDVSLNLLTPFCRTPEDGKTLVKLVRDYGLDNILIGGMVELPSNVVLAEEFAEVFDFFLVGSMDLTQSTYMADRSLAKSSKYCDTNQRGTKAMVSTLLKNLQGNNKEILISSYEVFSGMEQYLPLLGNNKLHLVVLPDKIEEYFFKVKELEDRLGI